MLCALAEAVKQSILHRADSLLHVFLAVSSGAGIKTKLHAADKTSSLLCNSAPGSLLCQFWYNVIPISAKITSKCHLHDIVGAGFHKNCEYAGRYCFFGHI